MTPQDRRQIGPTLFLVGGILFLISSVRGDATLSAQLFGVGAGLVAVVYGGLRLRAERRRPPSEPPGDDAGPPPA